MRTQARGVYINLLGGVAALVFGALVATWLVWNRPVPVPQARVHEGQLVEVIIATSTVTAPRVRANGTVVPARRVTIRPQVSGRVVARHPGLVPGGFVTAGEVVLRIDPRDYEIAVDAARNGVERARAERAMEEGRQLVARQEWSQYGSPEEEPPPLALREPQLRQAELEIARATQQLARARLDLERTHLTAPFSGVVTEATVEVGELATPTTSAATLVSLDEFWVEVAVPVEDLAHLAIPGRDGERGSRAYVRSSTGSQIVEHRGRILRLLGELEPSGRTARLLVRVRHPLTTRPAPPDGALPDDDASPVASPVLRQHPLLLGSYVAVEFEGNNPQPVIELPRHAVREGNWVYVASESDTLDVRPVAFGWRTQDTVAVTSGLTAGERVIVSSVATPVAGMPLRVRATESAAPLPVFVEPEAESTPGSAATPPASRTTGGEGSGDLSTDVPEGSAR